MHLESIGFLDLDLLNLDLLDLDLLGFCLQWFDFKSFCTLSMMFWRFCMLGTVVVMLAFSLETFKDWYFCLLLALFLVNSACVNIAVLFGSFFTMEWLFKELLAMASLPNAFTNSMLANLLEINLDFPQLSNSCCFHHLAFGTMDQISLFADPLNGATALEFPFFGEFEFELLALDKQVGGLQFAVCLNDCSLFVCADCPRGDAKALLGLALSNVHRESLGLVEDEVTGCVSRGVLPIESLEEGITFCDADMANHGVNGNASAAGNLFRASNFSQ